MFRFNTGFNSNKPYVMVPYVKGMSESCRKICRKHGIEMHFKGGSTIKDLLVHPKGRDTILQKNGGDLQIKVWQVWLWRIYCGIRQNFCRKVQRAHEGSLTHPWPPQNYWSWPFFWKLQHFGQGGPKYCQIHQRSNTNQSQWLIPK